MGFPNPFKAAKKALTKVAKPFRKISKKFVPRELRWAAPYLAAATPFMLPGNFALGSMNPALSRGIMSSLANIGGQAIADPEGEDINLLSTLMAGGTGALGAEGMGTKLRSGIERGVTGVDQFGDIAVPYTDSIGFFQGAENLGREGLAQAADFLGGSAEGLASLGKDPASLFKKGGAKANPQPPNVNPDGVRCYIRYNNMGIPYRTCNDAEGRKPRKPKSQITPQLTPEEFADQHGGYSNLSEGQTRTYHRLYMREKRLE